jgi:hypothetical protein
VKTGPKSTSEFFSCTLGTAGEQCRANAEATRAARVEAGKAARVLFLKPFLALGTSKCTPVQSTAGASFIVTSLVLVHLLVT